MKLLLSIFQPAPLLPVISDPSKITKDYRYWRTRIFYSIYIGYFFFYLSRKSLIYVTPYLTTALEFSKSNVGILTSIFAIMYGISKFLSGILCDRSNPRFFMAFGLISTGILNISFGLSSSLIWFAFFWCLNAWFQGWGWPACAKQLTYWFSVTERGRWWSLCTTSYTVGGFATSIIVTGCAQSFGWRFGMLLPGLICIIIGAILINRLRDVPESLGLPPIEQLRNEPKVSLATSTLSIGQALNKYILSNPAIWPLAFAYFFIYIVREAVNNWYILFLIEMRGFSPVDAAISVGFFEVGGFLGLLLAGWGSDFLYGGKRIPLSFFSALMLMVVIMSFWYFPMHNVILCSCLTTFIGLLIAIPQLLIGIAATECVDKEAASTANGFVGLFAYLGATVGGFPLIKIAEAWGLYAFLLALSISVVIASMVVMPLWSLKNRTAGKITA